MSVVLRDEAAGHRGGDRAVTELPVEHQAAATVVRDTAQPAAASCSMSSAREKCRAHSGSSAIWATIISCVASQHVSSMTA